MQTIINTSYAVFSRNIDGRGGTPATTNDVGRPDIRIARNEKGSFQRNEPLTGVTADIRLSEALSVSP